MTTALYAHGKAAILKGQVPMASGSIRAIPMFATYAPDLTADHNLEDVAGGFRAGDAVALTSKTFTEAAGKVVFDADDITFSAVPSGDPIVGVLLYLHTGDEATSVLIGYFDYFANLPITPDGRDIVGSWPDTTDRIFSW